MTLTFLVRILLRREERSTFIEMRPSFVKKLVFSETIRESSWRWTGRRRKKGFRVFVNVKQKKRNSRSSIRFEEWNTSQRTESFKNLNRAIEDFLRSKISSDHRYRKYMLISNCLRFLDWVARFLDFKIYFLWICMRVYVSVHLEIL